MERQATRTCHTGPRVVKIERSNLEEIRNELVNEIAVRGWGHWSNRIEVEVIQEGYTVKVTINVRSSRTMKVVKTFSRGKDQSRIAHEIGEALQKQARKVNV